MSMDIPPPRDGSVLPREPEPFRGVIGDTYKQSTPVWPERLQGPPNAPHIIVIMCDDLGFGQLSCFGGAIDAPNIAALAAGGLRYNNFHTTALCSPTRAALLTGRNHHSVGFSAISEMAKGFPSHSSFLPKSAATFVEILRQSGYSTYCCGKWHLTPFAEGTAAGPYERWPLGLGFERFYGFLPAATDHWYPMITVDNHRVAAPSKADYHFSEDMVDQAIRMMRDQQQIATGRPIFLYLPFGAPHAPLQAPAAYIERYRGRFDDGWDALRQRTFERQKQMGIIPADCDLPPRNPGVKEWSTLSADERRLFARLMETFAGMMDHADAQIGRLVAELRALDMYDDTLLLFLSDNGASQEGLDTGTTSTERLRALMPMSVEEMLPQIDDIGGPESDPHYPKGWAMAGNTPFRRYKRDTHRGANTDPLIAHWPARIKDKGAIRSHYHHVVDIYPTLLEVAGLTVPTRVNGVDQMPLEGQSFAQTFFDGTAPQVKKVQYYEMLGSRAIWEGGWTAVTWHKPGTDWDLDQWELYHQANDYSQAHDLAQKHPEKLRTLMARWWEEARKFNVLPLDDRGIRFYDPTQPKAGLPREAYRYYPNTSPVPNPAMPVLVNRTFEIACKMRLGSAADEGVLVAVGGLWGGWALYVRGRQLVYVHNFLKVSLATTCSDILPLQRDLTVGFRWTPLGLGEGKLELLVDSAAVATLAKVQTAMRGMSFAQEGLQIGRAWSSPIAPAHFSGAFAFTGLLKYAELKIAPVSEHERDLDKQLQDLSSGAQ